MNLKGAWINLSSVIILPQIIAKHLFPENSEEVRFGFVKDNQKADQAFFDNTDDNIKINFLNDEDSSKL